MKKGTTFVYVAIITVAFPIITTSHTSRNLITKTFTKCDVQLVTAGSWHGIDHIAISKKFIGENPVLVSEWNTKKTLSDHKGISVQFD